MPAEAPPATGVSTTLQESPPSRLVKTRAGSTPPVARWRLPAESLWRHVPLAAKPNSPSRAGGIPALSMTSHVWPPSSVRMMRKTPSTGSDIA
jgi:hypothetical protein